MEGSLVVGVDCCDRHSRVHRTFSSCWALWRQACSFQTPAQRVASICCALSPLFSHTNILVLWRRGLQQPHEGRLWVSHVVLVVLAVAHNYLCEGGAWCEFVGAYCCLGWLAPSTICSLMAVFLLLL